MNSSYPNQYPFGAPPITMAMLLPRLVAAYDLVAVAIEADRFDAEALDSWLTTLVNGDPNPEYVVTVEADLIDSEALDSWLTTLINDDPSPVRVVVVESDPVDPDGTDPYLTVLLS